MPSDDDQLRDRLQRERALRAHPHDAAGILTELRPAMHRARRRRVAAMATLAILALGGVAGVIQIMRIGNPNTIRIAADTPSTEASEPGAITPASRGGTTDFDPSRPEATVRPGSDDGPLASVITQPADDFDGQIDASTTTARGTIPVAAPETVPAVKLVTTTTTATTTPTTTATTPTTGATSATSVTSTTAAGTRPSSTTVIPTTVAPQPEWFSSNCGSARAIRWPDTVELLEVVANPGYDYRLEDPDNGNLTIQFAGGGEDCELKIAKLDAD